MKNLDFSNEIIQDLEQSFISKLVASEKNEFYLEIVHIEKSIKHLKQKQTKLLDMKLDDLIDERTYLLKNNQIENELKDFYEQKEQLEKEDF